MPVSAVHTAPAAPVRRSLYAFAALGAGLMLAREAPVIPAVLWFAACQGLLLAAMFSTGRVCRVTLLLAVAAFGAGWYGYRVATPAYDALAALAGPASTGDGDGAPAFLTVEGMVLDTPRAPGGPSPAGGMHSAPPLRFRLGVEAAKAGAGWAIASGELDVRLVAPASALTSPASPLLGLRPGSTIRLTGRFTPIAGPLNPGVPDPRPWAAQDGRAGTLTVPDSALAAQVTAGAEARPGVWADALRAARSIRVAALARLRAGAGRALDAAFAEEEGDGDGGGEGQTTTPAEPGRAMLADLLLGRPTPCSRP